MPESTDRRLRRAALAFFAFMWVVTPIAVGQLSSDQFLGGENGLASGRRTTVTAFTGLTVIDGDPYWRIDLRPDLTFGRLGVGFKAVLLFGNPNGSEDGDDSVKVRTEDGEKWDTFGAYLRAVRYVQWATPRAPLYGRYGELFDVRIGNGLLMEGYSNLDRRGLRVNVNRRMWGVETLLNNLDQPELFGGRAYIRPLRLAAVDVPVLSKVVVGGTYLVDVNPVPGVSDVTLNAVAADLTLPLIDRELLSLRLYDELALLTYPEVDPDSPLESVKGNAIGVGLDLSRLHAKLEYRTFDKGFEPTLFGYDYEFRARTTGYGIQQNVDSTTTMGYYGAAAIDLGSSALVSGTFEDYNGDSPAGDPRLALRFIETDLIDQIDVRAYYTKRGIHGSEGESFLEDLVDLDERSLFVMEIAYKLSGPLQIVATREFRFREREDEQGFETIKKTTVQVGLSF